MTYARSRLWLGMTAVGTITLTAMALLASQLHSNSLQVASGAHGWEFILLVGAVDSGRQSCFRSTSSEAISFRNISSELLHHFPSSRSIGYVAFWSSPD